MKYLCHVPVEQYGFISVEVEGTAAMAINAYWEIGDMVKVQPQGLPEKDFRELYDKVASAVPVNGDPGVLDQLNPQQRFALNQAKLFVKRNQHD